MAGVPVGPARYPMADDLPREGSGPVDAERMTAEDLDMDRQWRNMFGQPLPILGCLDIVRRILERPPTPNRILDDPPGGS